MYARVLTIEMGPGMWDEGAQIAERWLAGVATLPGFVDVIFFGDEETGHHGAFSLWETLEHAEAAEQYRPEVVQEALARLAVKPPVVRVFRVYEPRGKH